MAPQIRHCCFLFVLKMVLGGQEVGENLRNWFCFLKVVSIFSRKSLIYPNVFRKSLKERNSHRMTNCAQTPIYMSRIEHHLYRHPKFLSTTRVHELDWIMRKINMIATITTSFTRRIIIATYLTSYLCFYSEKYNKIFCHNSFIITFFLHTVKTLLIFPRWKCRRKKQLYEI